MSAARSIGASGSVSNQIDRSAQTAVGVWGLLKIVGVVLLSPVIVILLLLCLVQLCMTALLVVGGIFGALGLGGVLSSFSAISVAIFLVRPSNHYQTKNVVYPDSKPEMKISSIAPRELFLPGLLATLALSSLVFSFGDITDNLNNLHCYGAEVRTFVWMAIFFTPNLISYGWLWRWYESSMQFCGYKDRFCLKQKNNWEYMNLADIIQVTLERKIGIADSAYHEDDSNQHLLCFHSIDGVIAIELSKFNDSRSRRLFEWLNVKLDKRVFSAPAKSLLRKFCSSTTFQSPIKQDEFSLTTAWEADMNRNLLRTNYVLLEPGQSLQEGRFNISAYLSSGGFSTTYLANTANAERVVLKESALPVNLAEFSRNQISELFAREAKLLQRCCHKNIASILDFFQENNREYLVLEHIDGAPLSALVRRSGPLSETQVISWGQEMAALLEYLHELAPPIIHRDFTPENLILHRSGEIYLIDFGAANEFIGQATGTIVGKQSYMAPEQLQGKAMPESDIYALGATLYFLLSRKDPLPLSELRPLQEGLLCSEKFSNLIADCTKLDPQMRIGSASELQRRLAAL